jgi:predicted dehydrogenase
MTEHVRVGMIGTSGYGDLAHLPRLKSHPRARIAAICGRGRARAEEMAAKYDIPLVFTDYREMIEKGDLDAVVVATPEDLHYPMTMDALDAGLHVLCEKPMALNAGHAREMYHKAEEKGVKHMVCFTWRWVPCFRYLKQLVDQGYTGRADDLLLRYVSGHGRGGRYRRRVDPSGPTVCWAILVPT